eukprot:55316-Pyramimonas_sp.AAC.1
MFSIPVDLGASYLSDRKVSVVNAVKLHPNACVLQGVEVAEVDDDGSDVLPVCDAVGAVGGMC